MEQEKATKTPTQQAAAVAEQVKREPTGLAQEIRAVLVAMVYNG